MLLPSIAGVWQHQQIAGSSLPPAAAHLTKLTSDAMVQQQLYQTAVQTCGAQSSVAKKKINSIVRSKYMFINAGSPLDMQVSEQGCVKTMTFSNRNQG